MKRDKQLSGFLKSIEMTVLPQEDQLLLDAGAWNDISGNHVNIGKCLSTNNCNGGNCVSGCGA